MQLIVRTQLCGSHKKCCFKRAEYTVGIWILDSPLLKGGNKSGWRTVKILDTIQNLDNKAYLCIFLSGFWAMARKPDHFVQNLNGPTKNVTNHKSRHWKYQFSGVWISHDKIFFKPQWIVIFLIADSLKVLRSHQALNRDPLGTDWIDSWIQWIHHNWIHLHQLK